MPLDVPAADTVGVDELWPSSGLWTAGGSTIPNIPYGSSGLNLTGNNQRIGMWEDWEDAEFNGLVGGVEVAHPLLLAATSQGQLVRKMTQGEEDTNYDFVDDSPNVPDSNHATAVASAMSGIGLNATSGNFNFGQQARGPAFNSIVYAHERLNFNFEFPPLADPLGQFRINLANNSRGIATGWLPNATTGGWTWWGPSQTSATEDWKFGAYSGFIAGYDYFPSNLDTLANASPNTLLLFGSGNFREGGPGSAANAGTYAIGESGITDTAPRDYINGDAGGYDTLAPSAAAKNILAVGSCTDVADGHLSTSPEPSISGFSSAGPTDDGRIKPEIVAPGEILISSTRAPQGSTLASLGQNVTFNQSGTSFSTPVVTGGLALSLERRQQLQPLWASSGYPYPIQSSSLRALAVHTARDLGAPGPDFRAGYGLFNALDATTLVDIDASTGTTDGYDGTKPFMKELLFISGAISQFTVEAESSAVPLKATIAWTDPTGTTQTTGVVDQTTKRLRHDFDLRIYPPGTPAAELNDPNSSFAIKPWILDPDLTGKTVAKRSAPATKGDDSTNNLEQVVIENPIAGGEYIVRVTHKGTLTTGSQWVSMSLSGRTVQAQHNFQVQQFYQDSFGNWVLEWESIPGGFYQVQYSTDLQTWNNQSGIMPALSDLVTYSFPQPSSSQYYVRILRWH